MNINWDSATEEAVRHLQALIRIPTVNPPGNERPAADYLAEVLSALQAAWPHVAPLREHLFGLAFLMNQLGGNERNPLYWQEVLRVATVVAELVGQILTKLADVPYPFEHASGDVSVSDYLLNRLPPANEVGALFAAADELHDKLGTLYFRLMAQLAVTAEKVEAAIGLPRLPDPPEPRR